VHRGRTHRSRRKARSPAEYFLAAIGLLILIVFAAILVTPRGCRFGIDPSIGLQPSQPTPRPTHVGR